MNFNHIKEEHLNILREIHKKKFLSQRQLAKETGVSLGKLNYSLKALKEKGLIKIKNFKQNTNKITYIYILTPKGIIAKTKLTINFMRQKMFEYDQLKLEFEKIRKN